MAKFHVYQNKTYCFEILFLKLPHECWFSICEVMRPLTLLTKGITQWIAQCLRAQLDPSPNVREVSDTPMQTKEGLSDSWLLFSSFAKFHLFP